MVALLFSIVIVFLACHSCKLVLNIYEAAQVRILSLLFLISHNSPEWQMLQYGTIHYWPSWADKLTRWNHLMLAINSSSNIIIYVAKVSKTLYNPKPHLTFYRISSSGVLSS